MIALAAKHALVCVAIGSELHAIAAPPIVLKCALDTYGTRELGQCTATLIPECSRHSVFTWNLPEIVTSSPTPWRFPRIQEPEYKPRASENLYKPSPASAANRGLPRT
jgi:hypothetical protein